MKYKTDYCKPDIDVVSFGRDAALCQASPENGHFEDVDFEDWVV